MGLSAFYGSPVAEKDGIDLIQHAFSKGISFFDTADIYGPFTNEILVGKTVMLVNNLHLKDSDASKQLHLSMYVGKIETADCKILSNYFKFFRFKDTDKCEAGIHSFSWYCVGSA
eukprot:Gb_36730 [translate_table: standard]